MFTGFEHWTFSQALKVLHVIEYYGSSFKQENLQYYTYEVQCSNTGRGVESRGMAKYHFKSMDTNFIVLIFIFSENKVYINLLWTQSSSCHLWTINADYL